MAFKQRVGWLLQAVVMMAGLAILFEATFADEPVKPVTPPDAKLPAVPVPHSPLPLTPQPLTKLPAEILEVQKALGGSALRGSIFGQQAPASPPPVKSQRANLRQAARRLEELAAELEETDNFAQADRLRGIARSFWIEARASSSDGSPVSGN